LANHLQMHNVSAILALLERGNGNKTIARTLGVDRRTVRRYRELWLGGELSRENVPNPPPGFLSTDEQNDPIPPPGPGPASLCEAYRQIIEDKLTNEQHGKSIYYDLVREHGFQGSYDSLKRFLRRLRKNKPELVTRLYFPPGDAAQVDFGQGAPTDNGRGRYRKPHLFVMTLCSSRKAYREVVWDQKTETFLGCVIRAFEYFGGVPATVILDNLKAAIIHACWEDPLVNRQFQLLADHYGFVPLPCHPGRPKEKGMVENSVQYTQNMLAGRRFTSLAEQNAFLSEWEESTASKRIHGTTKMQVQAAFEGEKPSLKPLPPEPYRSVQIGYRRVHMDGRIEVKGAYYPIPEEHLGKEVEVRFDERMVRVFIDNKPVITHARVSKGTTAPRTFARAREVPTCRAAFERSAILHARELGPHTGMLGDAAVAARGTAAYRFVQSLRGMHRKYGATVVEEAAQLAVQRGIYRSRAFALLCTKVSAEKELTVELAQEHELIRPLEQYDLTW
jgi:transposase